MSRWGKNKILLISVKQTNNQLYYNIQNNWNVLSKYYGPKVANPLKLHFFSSSKRLSFFVLKKKKKKRLSFSFLFIFFLTLLMIFGICSYTFFLVECSFFWTHTSIITWSNAFVRSHKINIILRTLTSTEIW